jgi:hypothetical protein
MELSLENLLSELNKIPGGLAKNKTLLEGLQKKLVFEQDKAKESLLDESNLTD